MSADVTAEAPGKVVLLGEYAVVDGAPALVAAVDRGVRCEAWRGEGLHIETPGSDDRFVRPALVAADARGIYRFSAFNPPKDAETKVGLGSSAAATVAAIEASWTLAGWTFISADVFSLARAVHHRVQGSGSGIDVAASAYGGVMRYRPDAPAPLDLDLDLVVIWSGASASTGPRVQRYLAWTDRASFVRESEVLVDAFAADPIVALRAARRLLERMASDAGLDYRTPALDQIADLAEAHGGAGKPSGAGGGDIAVAVLPDADARTAFIQACAARGLAQVPVTLYRRGSARHPGTASGGTP